MKKTRLVRNIMVLTSWSYKEGLLQSSTLPYLKMIHSLSPESTIYLVTEEKDDWWKSKAERTAVNSELALHNIVLVPKPYHRFGLKKLIAAFSGFLGLWWLIVSGKISHIHCFCTPAGSFGYLLSVLSGGCLVLDSYEPHAEAMVENGTWSRRSVAFRLLWWLEKKQSQKAAFCISAATGMDGYALEKYGVEINLIGVRPCCVNLEQFQFHEQAANQIRKKLQWEDKIVCVYAGKLGGIYLEQEVFDFFRVANDFWKDRFRILLLTPSSGDELLKLCRKSGLPEKVLHWQTVSFSEMPNYLSVADFALTPVKPVPSKRFCTPIKDGEYWAIGLPVVITQNISDDSAIIDRHNAGAVMQALSEEAYLSAVQKIDCLLQSERAELRSRLRKLAEHYRNYSIAQKIYEKIYNQEKRGSTMLEAEGAKAASFDRLAN